MLEGRFIRLEPLGPGHAADLVVSANEDRDPYRYTFVPGDHAGMEAYVAEADAGRRAGHSLAFAVVRRSEGRAVGSTRFAFVERWQWPPGHPQASRTTPDVAEIGNTWLAASAVRTACNTEAKLLLLGFAFDVWDLHRVRFRTDRRNRTSWAALERIGAHFDGVLRADRTGADGTVRDSSYFSVLAAEWPSVRQRLTALLDR